MTNYIHTPFSERGWTNDVRGDLTPVPPQSPNSDVLEVETVGSSLGPNRCGESG